MGASYPTGCCGITRRGFLLGAGTGLAAGASLTWLAPRAWRKAVEFFAETPSFTGRTREMRHPEFAMPGRYPGRVIEIRHPDAVRPDHGINRDAVTAMMNRGMKELTGADDARESWKQFFQKGDVVGIKVNPVGRRPKPNEPGRVPTAAGSISSPEVLLQVVASLKEAGVRPQDIIVFERYADEFYDAGYADVMYERMMDGVRWYASAWRYSEQQVDIQGFDGGRDNCPPEVARHVVGYDPDVFVHMGFASSAHDRQ